MSPYPASALGLGAGPVPPPSDLDLVALEALAAQNLGPMAYAYYSGGADEEVLLGTRLMSDHGYRALQGLEDVVPRHEHKPTGEERAWARRLAKRFGNEKDLDDRTFIIAPSGGDPVGGLDVVAPKAKLPQGVEAFFADIDADQGHRLVVFGWAMPEDLAAGRLTR